MLESLSLADFGPVDKRTLATLTQVGIANAGFFSVRDFILLCSETRTEYSSWRSLEYNPQAASRTSAEVR